MKKHFIFLMLFASLSTYSQVPEWIHARECTGIDKIFCYTDVTTDDNNNIFSSGFSWPIVGSDNFDSKFIISKIGSQGTPVLEKSYLVNPMNNHHDDYLYSTTFSKVGNHEFLVSGGESNGNALLFSVKATDLSFHNKSNISGDGNGTSKITSVFYFNNFVYAIGTFKGNIKFRNPGQTQIKKSFTSTGITDIFVAKFSPGCGFIDAIQLKGKSGSYQNCFDLKIDNNGNLYFSIATGGNIDVGSQHLYSTYSGNGNYDLCIVKLNKLLPVSCSKIISGPRSDSEIKNSFFINNLSANNVFFNSFHGVYFPIAVSTNNQLCYFAISFREEDGPNIVGLLDIQTNISTFSQDNTLFSSIQPRTNSTKVTDLDISQCDSIYLSVLISSQDEQHSGVFYHHILSINSTNFSIINDLKSDNGNIRGSKICIDKNRNILFSGFFEYSNLSYNGDYNTELAYGTNCQLHSLCQAYTLKFNPCQVIKKEKKSIITGFPVLCNNQNTYWEYPLCGNCTTINPDCTYRLLPIGNAPDPQTSLSHYYDPIAKKVMIAFNPDFGTYNYPFKLYVECRIDCCTIDFNEITIYPAPPLNLNFNLLPVSNNSTNVVSLTASALPLNNPYIHYGWFIFEGEDNSSICKIKGEDTGNTNNYKIYEEWSDWDNSANGINLAYSGLAKNVTYVVYFCAVYEFTSSNGTEICGWHDVRQCFKIGTSGKLIKTGNSKSDKNNLKLTVSTKKQ